MVKPITPNEIKKKVNEFPDFVIEAFNYSIQEKWNGTYARVDQNEAIDTGNCFLFMYQSIWTRLLVAPSK